MNEAFDAVLAEGAEAMLGVFDATAQRLGTASQNIEKDFWVCWMLGLLFGREEWREALVFKGGTALFTQPAMPIKCAGAPQKAMYLSADHWRRAGVLSRLGILDQEAGDLVSARSRYEESLRIGSDTDSALLLGMLTQAAFNLGLIQNTNGDDDGAMRSWNRAMMLGMRAGHPSGWDPAAIAAFNLGHLYERLGDRGRARETLLQVGRIAEPGGTPVGLMAAAKAAMALASLAETEGLPGEVEASGQFARACELGRASRTTDGSLVAVQSALALAEQAVVAGRADEARRRLEQALEWSAACEASEVSRYVVLAGMRLGQTLAEMGEHAAAAERLADAYARGRSGAEPWVREIAAQAACSLHRVLCSMGRWAEARSLAEDAVAFAGGLESAMGRGLAAAALYAQAFQKLHDGDQPGARTLLGSVANVIVIEEAHAESEIGFTRYFKVGAPVTIASTITGVAALLAMHALLGRG